MAEEASFPAGHRLSDDLRRIREDRGVSIDKIHSETRIARTLIESFEEGELYDHPTYNRVYLRSFIKAYADAVEIARERALQALDEALNGTYQHELAQEYLSGEASAAEPTSEESDEDASSSSSEAPPEGPTAGGPEGRGGIVGPPRAVGEEPEEAEIPMDDPPDDAATEGTSTPDDPGESSQGDSSVEESDQQDPFGVEDPDHEPPSPPEPDLDSGDGVDEEGGGMGAWDEVSTGEEASDSGDVVEETDSDEPETPDMTGPEALRSDPDEDDAESEDRSTPAWMEEDGDADSTPDDVGRPASDTSDPPSMGEGMGTGVVGEPTELGSGGDDRPPEPASPSGERRTQASSAGSGVADLLGDANRRIVFTGIGIAVVLFVLIGLGVAYFSSEANETEEATSTPSVADTATTGATPAPPDTATQAASADTVSNTSTPERPPPANVTLGDPIYLLVLATDNVSALRLQRDNDLRRPYWIEEGEASVFPFQRRAIIGSEFEDIRLFIEGYEYPLSPADTAGGLELDRATLQAFVDTLRGTPEPLSVTPDTIPVGPIEGTPSAEEDTTLDETPSE